MGFLRQFLGRPSITFNPCDYGDAYNKKTDIWGYFKEPKKRHVQPISEIAADGKRYSSVHLHIASPEIRAMTPPGFAKAFMEANK